jgi:hypothetical protein
MLINFFSFFVIFVLLCLRIFSARANFSPLEILGFGYFSRQDAKFAKFGNLFCFFAVFAPLREIIPISVAALPR